jgi:hypothetical protein
MEAKHHGTGWFSLMFRRCQLAKAFGGAAESVRAIPAPAALNPHPTLSLVKGEARRVAQKSNKIRIPPLVKRFSVVGIRAIWENRFGLGGPAAAGEIAVPHHGGPSAWSQPNSPPFPPVQDLLLAFRIRLLAGPLVRLARRRPSSSRNRPSPRDLSIRDR